MIGCIGTEPCQKETQEHSVQRNVYINDMIVHCNIHTPSKKVENKDYLDHRNLLNRMFD